MPSKTYLKDLVYQVNGAAIEVHKYLGPGLLESVYHKYLVKELSIREFNFQSELVLPIHYIGITVETDLRYDLFIENR
jgi:GxxExxY protein